MAWSPWLHKAYAAYDEAERKRKARNALAAGVPVPPPGFQLLLGADGAYLKGADGAYLYGVAA